MAANNKDHGANTFLDEESENRRIISQLPREKGWIAGQLCQYQGFWYHVGFAIEGVMLNQQHFKAKPSDVFVTAFPKGSITWLKSLVFAIMNRHNNHDNYDTNRPNLLTSSPHECVPFLELAPNEHDFFENQEDELSPRLLGTHIPLSSLPPSVASSGCKIVYICRDPKDVFVSLWHFAAKLRTRLLEVEDQVTRAPLSEVKAPLPFQEAFEMFCDGVCPFGPFWDHVLGYWKASVETPKKVLFLNYEDIQREPLAYVKKLGEFLGRPFGLEEETDAQRIVDLCSFEHLSNLPVNKDGVFRHYAFTTRNDVFFRRGVVGDWKNHLTPEMAARIDRITQQKLDGSGLTLV